MNWMEEKNMGYTPALDGYDAFQPVLDRARHDAVTPVRSPRATLRFGGLSMDAMTGSVVYRGTALKLSVAERELLAALLRRAGQIVSCEQLASAIGSTASAVDKHIAALRGSLKHAGASTVPCDVNGLGYVLWRS
jgi:two-component system, OmpR family, catabolic regulation response regulator CreB